MLMEVEVKYLICKITVDAEREGEIETKTPCIIFTVTQLNFAARLVAPLSLPVYPNCEVFCDLSSIAQMSPHTSNTE